MPGLGERICVVAAAFCKMAAFKARIQDFFRDYFGDRYETATVKDMFGKRHKVKDIEVITTDNAMKWLKFDVSYKDWCGWVEAEQKYVRCR